MSNICDKCGLPKDICVCEAIAREEEKIEIFTTKRRYKKTITVITGLSKEVDSKKILKEMKTKLACGGTVKDNEIELQGDHKLRVKNILISLGFRPEQINSS